MIRFLVPAVVLLMSTSLACLGGATTPTSTPSPQVAGPANTPAPAESSSVEPSLSTIVDDFFLKVLTPENESVVRTSSIEVSGSTVLDAVVTVNGDVVEVDSEGRFSTRLILDPGPNVVEIIASDFTGRQEGQALTLIYTES